MRDSRAVKTKYGVFPIWARFFTLVLQNGLNMRLTSLNLWHLPVRCETAFTNVGKYK